MKEQPSKSERKRLLIEMMKEDEKNGMYEKSDNELIDDFYASQGGKRALKEDLWFYESDWNMLMPVVEKIEALHDASYLCRIVSRRCIIYDSNIANQSSVWMASGEGIITSSINQDSKLIATYKAVVEFIKWFNSQQHESK